MKFEFYNPTRVFFGAGMISRLGAEAKKIGNKAFLVIGKGSVKKNGTLDKAMKALKDAGLDVVLFEGIEPNPRLGTLLRAKEALIRAGADMVIALGGGSVMDASKVIATLPFYEGNPWDMMHVGSRLQRLPTKALPVITVPTLAATGSEMNEGAVITNEETCEKTYVGAECMFPKVAIVDPELTLTVPKDQTAYGLADIITHVTESYFNSKVNTPLQDMMAEGVVRVVIEYGRKVVMNLNDLEARAQVQWASVVALNDWVQCGTNAPFPVHQIEHVLSAHHDIAHGAGLAIVSPAWMKFAWRHNQRKFRQFAERVFGITGEGAEERGIEALENFFKEVGCPTRLSEVGIDKSRFERYAQDTVRIGGDGTKVHGIPPLEVSDIIEILKLAA